MPTFVRTVWAASAPAIRDVVIAAAAEALVAWGKRLADRR